ncbi:hypothetical protein [Larkinella rosea]|uniref:Uncharacterized protein n=1 Tax=Larkinella rosea TaxID=2025312 RepID=A0A3P1BM92_9BACT|nr:hypothetical protein [Larkinella rosea]RRB02145.1 hypothetical protein EHT25_16815 [Larkinella rosea]
MNSFIYSFQCLTTAYPFHEDFDKEYLEKKDDFDNELKEYELLPESNHEKKEKIKKLKNYLTKNGEHLRILNSLNAAEDSIVKSLEKEVRFLLPPGLLVKADVTFSEGSLVMYGTVTLISWAGTLVFDTIKEEVTDILKGCVKRSFKSALARAGLAIGSNLEFQDNQPLTQRQAPISQTQSDEPRSVPAVQPKPLLAEGRTQLLLLTLILFLQLIFLIDRFFLINISLESRESGRTEKSGTILPSDTLKK